MTATASNSKKNVNSLIYRYYPSELASMLQSEDDLLFMGSINLQYLIAEWRRERDRIVKTLKKCAELLELLHIERIKEIVSQNETPIFPEIEHINFNGEKGLRSPGDLASFMRQKGTTTFCTCGWCEHVCGQGPHSCSIQDTQCSIISYTSVNFDTPCKLVAMNEDELNYLRQQIQQNQEDLRVEKSATVDKIKKLTTLAQKAEKKPPFIKTRPRDWFKYDTEILYNEGGVWHKGVVLDDKIGKIWVTDTLEYSAELGYHLRYPGFDTHGILKDWELQYLKDNPEYTAWWADPYLRSHPNILESIQHQVSAD